MPLQKDSIWSLCEKRERRDMNPLVNWKLHPLNLLQKFSIFMVFNLHTHYSLLKKGKTLSIFREWTLYNLRREWPIFILQKLSMGRRGDDYLCLQMANMMQYYNVFGLLLSWGSKSPNQFQRCMPYMKSFTRCIVLDIFSWNNPL